MNGFCNDFLTRACGAEDQRVDGTAGNGESLGDNTFHGLAMTDDTAHVIFAAQCFHQLHIMFLESGSDFFQLMIALFQLFNQCGALKFPRFHLDRHHAEGFGQPFQFRCGRAFFGQFEQSVFVSRSSPGQIVA